ncbi:MAG: WD40 repeat domain-containing protein [Planctomycetota bacterium]|jgi:hypothetical protein
MNETAAQPLPKQLPWHHRAPVLTMALNCVLILTIFLTRERWGAWQPSSRYAAPWHRDPVVSLRSRRAIFFGDRIELRDLDSGTLIACYAGEADRSGAGFSSDGSRAWIRGGVSESIAWWLYCPPKVVDAVSGEVLFSTEVGRDTSSVYFSPGGEFVFITPVDGKSIIRNTSSGQVVGSFPGPKPAAHEATFSQSGRYVYMAASAGKGVVWDSVAGECLMELDGEAVSGAGFLPGEEHLVLLCRKDDAATIRLVSLKTYETSVTVRIPGSLAFLSRCNTRLLHAVESGGSYSVRIRNVATGAEIVRFPVAMVGAMPKFTASGRFVAIPGHTGASLHDTQTGRLITEWQTGMFFADLAKHLPSGRRLFLKSGGPTGLIPMAGLTVMDVESGEVLDVIGRVAAFVVASDEAVLVEFFRDDAAVALVRRVRPEEWWGVLWLPHFWLIVALAAAVVWSGWRDVRRMRRRERAADAAA